MRAPLPLAGLLLTVGLLATGCDSVGGTPASSSDFVPVDPRQAYLRTDDGDALDAPAVRLRDYEVTPGDVVCARVVGDFTSEPGARASDRDLPMLTAVFSATDILLAPDQTNRVPGAIDAGDDVSTLSTASGGATDIDEDFDATNGCVEVPEGAVYAFLAPYATRYSDNVEAAPNGQRFGLLLRR